jgi:cbb3-type cytochrome oxidase subunit 1
MNEMTMDRAPAGLVWFRVAVVYFALGIALGIVMGITNDHSLFGVHAHLNLLGWASLALIGLIYQHMPYAGANRLAKMHFWLHNLGLPVMMFGLAAKFTGHTQFEPALVIGALVTAVAVMMFAYNVLFSRP